mgnify:CR=1 FL=1|jgi:hypothetical protein
MSNDLKQLRKQIGDLTINEQEEIFKLFVKYECKYTRNNNGIFINMTSLSDDVLNEIHKLIDYSNNNVMLEIERADIVNSYISQ